MTTTGRFVLSAVLATVALAVVLAAGALSVETSFALYVLAIGGISVLALVRVAGAGALERPSLFEHMLRDDEELPTRPADLLRVERDLILGLANAGGADTRLLPLLRSAAAVRLSARHGIELDRRPEAARARLGVDVWELLRPDRPRPADAYAAGISEQQVAHVVDVLERL